MSKVIFLDLDGTLTDAGPGIKNCFNYALERMGLPEIRKNNDWIVGPPLWDSFAKVGVTDDQLNHAVDLYRDCLLYTSPSPRDLSTSRMPSSA